MNYPDVNGCRYCGVARLDHAQRWHHEARWHTFTNPTDEQRKTRLLAIKAVRSLTEEAPNDTD